MSLALFEHYVDNIVAVGQVARGLHALPVGGGRPARDLPLLAAQPQRREGGARGGTAPPGGLQQVGLRPAQPRLQEAQALRGAHELLQSNKTFLNRSLLGQSSLNGELLIEMDSSYDPKKELSENSCPAVLNNEEHDDLFSGPGVMVDDKPRFTKTKNLLRNLSNYMHKFLLYNRRARRWVSDYFRARSAREAEEEEAVAEQTAEFLAWVGELSIGNFNDYELVWTRPHRFRALYRALCYRYYKNEAYCDILRSRLTTKEISVRYLVQFIEGILQPAQFYRFK